MKKNILALLVLVAVSCKAQTIYNISTPPEERTVTENYYYKDIDNYNDNFVGAWEWVDGNSSFTLTLQEYEQYSDPVSPTIFIDAIFGKYTYVENGQVITDITTINTWNNMKVAVSYKTPTEYSIVIADDVSNTHKIGTLTLTSPTTLVMELHDSGGIKISNGVNLAWALPTNLVLTKIN